MFSRKKTGKNGRKKETTMINEGSDGDLRQINRELSRRRDKGVCKLRRQSG